MSGRSSTADFLHGGSHALRLGPVESIPYFQKQERLTFARVGITDPISLDDYSRTMATKALTRALEMSAPAIVQEVTDSGLRGRGGAAFPTGIKWKTVLDAPADQKYVTCNADEGDSGTFSIACDGRRPFVLLEGDVFLIRGRVEHGLPLDAGGEGRPAATTQPGVGHFLKRWPARSSRARA